MDNGKLKMNLVVLAVILGASYFWLRAIVWGDTFSLLLVLALAVAVFSLIRWQVGVVVLVIAICFEGMLYRAFPSQRLIILFLKGLLVLPIYMGILIQYKWKGKTVFFDRKILVPLLIFFAISFVQLFNPNVSSLMGGLVSLGLLWLFLPLYFVGYHLVDSKRFLLVLLVILAITSISVSLMGIYQFYRGVDVLITPGFAYENPAIWGIGMSGTRYFRPPATFTFGTQLGLYLMFAMPVLIGSLQVQMSLLKKSVFLVGAILAFIMTVLSGSRAMWVWVTLEIVFLVALVRTPRQKISTVVIILLLFVVSYPLIGQVFRDRVPTIWFDIGSRLRHGFFLMPGIALSQTILGKGAGTATSAARYFTPNIFTPESYWVKIMYEFGIPGLISFVVILMMIVRRGASTLMSLKDRDLQWVGTALFVFVVISAVDSFWYGFDQTPMNVYFWLFAGILMKLSELDKDLSYKRDKEGEKR